jgi:hypothetical protein
VNELEKMTASYAAEQHVIRGRAGSDRSAFMTSRLIAVLCLLSCISCTHCKLGVSKTSNEWRKDDEGAQVEEIASALRKHSEQHGGKLPVALSELVPNYVSSASHLWLKKGKYTYPEGAVLCYIPAAPIPDPEHKGCKMLAFSTCIVDYGRLIIDSDLRVGFVGEGRFQKWMAGITPLEKQSKLPAGK